MQLARQVVDEENLVAMSSVALSHDHPDRYFVTSAVSLSLSSLPPRSKRYESLIGTDIMEFPVIVKVVPVLSQRV